MYGISCFLVLIASFISTKKASTSLQSRRQKSERSHLLSVLNEEDENITKTIAVFMYRRPILCTLYGAVDFLNVLKKGCWVGGGVIGT